MKKNISKSSKNNNLTNKNDKYFWIINIILIILILMLLQYLKFGEINNGKIPTGNIDIFDINVNCGCDENDIPKFEESTDKDKLGAIYISDKKGDYIYQQRLNIFNNQAFEYTNKIAPGVGNTYEFIVHNNMEKDINYNLKMYEKTQYDINMKYRLKRNNKYIIGNDKEWVDAEKLQTTYYDIKGKGLDKYSLEWKWFDNDEQDTFIGKNMTEEYKLNVRFYFKLIENK